MSFLSGAIQAGVTSPDNRVARLSDVGVSERFTVQLASVGVAATVTFDVGPSASGPWETLLTATNADAFQQFEYNPRTTFCRVAVTAGTTDAGFEANLF